MALSSKQKEQVKRSYRQWRRDPWSWVQDKFSVSISAGRIRFSTQQREYFVVLASLIRAKFKQHLDVLEGKPQEFSEEERELLKKHGISIMAGKGVGKDFITAMTMAWFMDCFFDCKIIATGSNAQHLRSVLWAEFENICSLANPAGEDKDGRPITCLQALFEVQVGRILHKDNPKMWFSEAVTINKHATREDQAGSIAGRHARFMLVVVDEAASTPDVVLDKLEETLTFPCNFALMIFNPEKNNCYAVKSHYDPRLMDLWVQLRWNAEESELVKPEIIQSALTRGRDSFKYRVSVLGLPPLVTSNTFLPPDWVYSARDRELSYTDEDPVIAGVDIGGGGDSSVICIRQGGVIKKFLYNNSKNQMEVADWVAVTMDCEGAVVGCVDIVGLGRGAYDRLCQMGVNVRPVDARGKAMQDDTYFNMRSQMYMNMRNQFQDSCIAIPDNNNFIEQLLQLTYFPEEKNKIMPKDELRKLLEGASPDEMDAAALSFAYPDYVFRIAKFNIYKQAKRRNYAIV